MKDIPAGFTTCGAALQSGWQGAPDWHPAMTYRCSLHSRLSGELWCKQMGGGSGVALATSWPNDMGSKRGAETPHSLALPQTIAWCGGSLQAQVKQDSSDGTCQMLCFFRHGPKRAELPFFTQPLGGFLGGQVVCFIRPRWRRGQRPHPHPSRAGPPGFAKNNKLEGWQGAKMVKTGKPGVWKGRFKYLRLA